MLQLASLDFLDRAENLLQVGRRGLFIKAQELFDDMYRSLADHSSRKLIIVRTTERGAVDADRGAPVAQAIEEGGDHLLVAEECVVALRLLTSGLRRDPK